MPPTMPQWTFMMLPPGYTVREPVNGEFFATEAITGVAEALVREAIQNSLDARHGAGPVRVRIRISGPEGSLAPERVAPYLDGAWPHFLARGNGLRDAPTQGDPCPFILFEDFGTTGLDGDPGMWHPVEGQKNGFYNFFWAEGYSDKGEQDRGRWGVGKFVFPRSSRVSAFWAVTRRASDQRLLMMGRAILRSHSVGLC